MLLRRMAGRHPNLSGCDPTCVVSIAGDIWDRDSYRNYCDQTYDNGWFIVMKGLPFEP